MRKDHSKYAVMECTGSHTPDRNREEGGVNMLSGYQTEEELIQNMVDAGCKEDMVTDVLCGMRKECT